MVEKTTGEIVENLIAYRDGVSARHERDLLADACNRLVELDRQLSYVRSTIDRGLEYGVFDFSVFRAEKERQAAIALALSQEGVTDALR